MTSNKPPADMTEEELFREVMSLNHRTQWMSQRLLDDQIKLWDAEHRRRACYNEYWKRRRTNRENRT